MKAKKALGVLLAGLLAAGALAGCSSGISNSSAPESGSDSRLFHSGIPGPGGGFRGRHLVLLGDRKAPGNPGQGHWRIQRLPGCGVGIGKIYPLCRL